MPRYTDESRREWKTHKDTATNEEIRTGCFQRIALSLETMAQGRSRLEQDRDRYKRWWEEEQERTAILRSRIRGLRGTITRMKRER